MRGFFDPADLYRTVEGGLDAAGEFIPGGGDFLSVRRKSGDEDENVFGRRGDLSCLLIFGQPAGGAEVVSERNGDIILCFRMESVRLRSPMS